ncbi:MAG: hypothetical protein Q9187_005512 [Circinaria calcarea]
MSKPEAMRACQTTPPDKIRASPTLPLTNGKSLLPITPENEAIQKVLQIFKKHRQGTLKTQDTISLPLSFSDYNELWKQLEADSSLQSYVRDKVRHSYNPISALLHIKMPAEPHEYFGRELSQIIRKGLEMIRSGTDTAAEYAQVIRENSHTTIDLQLYGNSFQRSPDGSFRHIKARFPGVIIEVAYSQTRKEVETKVKSYIAGSKGAIRIVLIVDLDYPRLSKASISIWQINQEIDEHTTDYPQDLIIPLDNFGPPHLAAGFDKEPRPKITIKMVDLARYFRDWKTAPASSTGDSLRFETECSPPPIVQEQPLTPEREGRFRSLEDRDEERSYNQDTAFKEPCRKRQRSSSGNDTPTLSPRKLRGKAPRSADKH